jgi:hypothetical protein
MLQVCGNLPRKTRCGSHTAHDILTGGWEIGRNFWEYAQVERIFCDPSFWQSPGKALGWERKRYKQIMPAIKVGKETHAAHIRSMKKPTPDHWKKEWHHFIDHLPDGKTADAFFETLP